MSVALYTHADCLLHDPGPGHPESPSRLSAVIEALKRDCPELEWRDAPLADWSDVARAHNPALLKQLSGLRQISERVSVDADTQVSAHSIDAALRAAGAGVRAVQGVLNGEFKRAFCAVRPPGHHATRDVAMGFCLINSVAVAAYAALDAGLERVAIVDFDVHHGNGTEDIFQAERRVMYVSTHQWPLYPGTGSPSDVGAGNIVNVALPPGTQSADYRACFAREALPRLDAFAPELVLISAGFDAHRLDPLAGLNLNEVDFGWITTELVAIAQRHAEGRVVSLLEGGYSLSALRSSVVAHVRALNAGISDPAVIPAPL